MFGVQTPVARGSELGPPSAEPHEGSVAYSVL